MLTSVREYYYMKELHASKRTETGKKKVQALRATGQVPAEVYGHGISNMHLSLDAKTFEKIYKEAGENTVLTLVIENKKHPVLIHNVDREPVKGDVQTVDLYVVKMDEKIQTVVPIEFVGEAPAVEAGGVLVKAMSEIEVEAFPADLPHEITVDVSSLKEIGDSLYVKDLPKKATYAYVPEDETVVASIAEPAPEEEAAPVAEEEVVGQVKVESEEKKEERASRAEGEK